MRSSPVSAAAFFDPFGMGGGVTGATGAVGRGAGPGAVSLDWEMRWSPDSAPATADDRGGLGPRTSASPTRVAARVRKDAPLCALSGDSPAGSVLFSGGSPGLVVPPGRPPVPGEPPPPGVSPSCAGWTSSPTHSHHCCASPSPSRPTGRPRARTRSRNRGRSVVGAPVAPLSSASLTRSCDKKRLPRHPREPHMLGDRRGPATQLGGNSTRPIVGP
jgi:hypothetical protein